MKLISFCALAFLASVRGFATDAIIEFRGVMTGDGATKLSLVDKASDTTRWVEIGQVFIGYTVKAYDPKTETATLTRMGKDYQIRLNTSKIEEAPATETSAPAPVPRVSKLSNEAARTIFIHLRQIRAAADQYCVDTGKTSVTLDELVGPTKYIKELQPEAGEDYQHLMITLQGNRVLAVTTASGESVMYDPDGNSSTFYAIRPGDTLAGIAKRVGTPTAQLAMLNNITDPAKLQAGQLLRAK